MVLVTGVVELLNPATVTVATAFTLAMLSVYFICPSLLLQVYFRFAVRWSGMKIKFAEAGNFKFCYGEKGQPSESEASMLLLHGFSADHYMWTPMVQRMPATIHIIALDLPGHGGSSDPAEDEEVGYTGQIKRIHQFVKLVNLDQKPFHIVGLSMGGTLAGLYSVEYPDLVHRLSICCPSMITPSESKFASNLKTSVEENNGKLDVTTCGLLPQTGAEMQVMLNLSRFYQTSFPNQILQGAADIRKKKNEFFLRLFHEIALNPSALEDSIHLIQSPVQLVWGKEDSIIDLSGLDVLKSRLTKCERTDVIPCCGHAITLDQPDIYTKIILSYWQEGQQR